MSTYSVITYTPTANYNGPDSFTYTASDGQADSNIANVSIRVNAVNDTPVANDQAKSIEEGTSVEIMLTATDVDGDTITYHVITRPGLPMAHYLLLAAELH